MEAGSETSEDLCRLRGIWMNRRIAIGIKRLRENVFLEGELKV
jgi:hypothetical protein